MGERWVYALLLLAAFLAGWLARGDQAARHLEWAAQRMETVALVQIEAARGITAATDSLRSALGLYDVLMQCVRGTGGQCIQVVGDTEER